MCLSRRNLFLLIYLTNSMCLSRRNLFLLICLVYFFTGDVFIVEKDITDLASLKIDSNLRNVIMILRHCNILREVRGGGYVRFVTTSRW